MVKKISSIILVITILFSFTVTGSAYKPEDPTKYPFILVHGMMGWGENTKGNNEGEYFGMSGVSVKEYLKSKGCEAYAPTVSPLGSAWDRACELYAQLTGTVVDYGAAHSAKAGHARYGRDYSDSPIMGRKWDLKEKINLVSHSFGGPTVSVFQYLMTEGAKEEIEAAPNDCSEFFKGGHDCIYSITTLESPHNGSPLANIAYDLVFPVYLFAVMMNIEGTKEDPDTDYMVDQWGLSCDPSTGKTANLNLKGILAIAKSNDHAAYDMSIQGAKDLERFTPSDKIYFFSYAADLTEEGGIFGRRSTSLGGAMLSATSNMIILMSNNYIDGVDIDKSWSANDGMVPVVSAQYPQNAENLHKDYSDDIKLEKGIWYVMPVVSGANHGYGMSGNEIPGLYDEIINHLNKTVIPPA